MIPDIPIHPVSVHFPIALFVITPLLALVGLLKDAAWLRRAAAVLFVVGFLSSVVANLSGEQAEEVAEDQGVPEDVIERHEDAGKLVMWVSGAGVVALIASAARPLRGVASVLVLLIQLATAGLVLNAGFHGGRLVYHHAAGVELNGVPVQHPGGGAGSGDDSESGRDEGED